MVLANNFSLRGYNVTVFSDIGAQLNKLVNNFGIKPYPSYSELKGALNSYNVVLYDSSGAYVKAMPSAVERWCKENAVCFRMSDAPPRHKSVSQETIKNRLPPDWKHEAKTLIKLNRALRGQYRGFYRPPIVTQLVNHLSRNAGFENAVVSNGLENTRKTKDLRKVILHPESSRSNKNWPVENYLTLAHGLKQRGFEPVVTVAPFERKKWLELVHKELEVPKFESLEDLAHFYMDAALLIGGDSGNAHLASSLGVPTLQLFKGWKNTPAWRAGWSKNQVLTAPFPYNLNKNSSVKRIRVSKVLIAVDQLVK